MLAQPDTKCPRAMLLGAEGSPTQLLTPCYCKNTVGTASECNIRQQRFTNGNEQKPCWLQPYDGYLRASSLHPHGH